MRFAIVGAGAIGAYLGAALARGGSDVVLVARGPHLEAMRRDGVRILSPRGDFHVRPEATDDLTVIRGAEVVVLAVKAYSLSALAPAVGAALAPGACVVAAQNGVPFWFFHRFGGAPDGWTLESVDPGGVIARSLGLERAVGCVVYPAAELASPGVVRHVEGTRIPVGEPDGTVSERCQRIAEAFAAGGLKSPIGEHLRDEIWLKLVGNAAFNPVSALTGATLAELGTLPETVALLRALMEECEQVGEALGLTLPVPLERRLQRGLEVGDHKTSTLQDLENGRPLEIDCLTGAVVELAARLGVAVPHTQAVHACLKLLDRLREDARLHPSAPGSSLI
jgi:2-dehydropantoate 2-reductase